MLTTILNVSYLVCPAIPLSFHQTNTVHPKIITNITTISTNIQFTRAESKEDLGSFFKI